MILNAPEPCYFQIYSWSLGFSSPIAYFTCVLEKKSQRTSNFACLPPIDMYLSSKQNFNLPKWSHYKSRSCLWYLLLSIFLYQDQQVLLTLPPFLLFFSSFSPSPTPSSSPSFSPIPLYSSSLGLPQQIMEVPGPGRDRTSPQQWPEPL